MLDVPKAAQIFVSHCHEDNRWCRVFVEVLRQVGADVWYDEHNLGYGTLRPEIERELRARMVFVVILSPASVTKPWVQREMDAAIGLQDREPNRIILPVVAERCEVPLLWEGYRRISGAGNEGLSASEAASRVIHEAIQMPTTAREAADRTFDEGQEFFAQRRYQDSLEAFERAIALNRQNPTYWIGKGATLVALQRHVEALAALDRALSLDPNNALAWFGKGTALASLQRPGEALTMCDRALTLDPNNSLIWGAKGMALEALKRPGEALVASDRALALDPKNVAIWDVKIRLLEQLRRWGEVRVTKRQRDAALR